MMFEKFPEIIIILYSLFNYIYLWLDSLDMSIKFKQLDIICIILCQSLFSSLNVKDLKNKYSYLKG